MNTPSATSKLTGGEWTGEGELWLDPTGDEAVRFECTASSTSSAIDYKWFHDDTQHRGRVRWTGDGGTFQDTYHTPEETACRRVEGARGVVGLTFDYPAGEGPDWGWEVHVSLRPGGQLVVQMTNVAPWGEKTRAARMVFEEEED